MAADYITAELVSQHLSTAVIGRAVHCFDSIDSTNRRARQYAESGAPEGTVILAEHQTGGRGRLNRPWLAPAHSSILCSVICYPKIEPEYLFRLTMAASIAVVNTLQTVSGIEAAIKWPNDIYAGEKKICGILTEVDCAGDAVRWAIVGMGLNVNWSLRGTGLEDQATSVSEILEAATSRLELVRELLRQIDKRYGRLQDREITQQWLRRCMHLDRQVQILSGTEVLEGIARGITEQGHLLLESNNKMHEIMCGDVSLRW